MRQQPYGWLSVGLMVGAVAAAAAAIYLLLTAHAVDVHAEVGRWLLTVAVAFAVTGALTMVVKQIDQGRTEREAWHAVLNDLVAANQTVGLARVRLDANQSAKTYQEQLAELMRARVELRRLCAIGMVIGDPPLRAHIEAMRDYLDALGREYEIGYLRVSRQQRLDELWLEDQLKAANVRPGQFSDRLPGRLLLIGRRCRAHRLRAGARGELQGGPGGIPGVAVLDGAPVLPDRLTGPQDPEEFPRLGALLDGDAFRIDTFRTNYKRAKARLEEHAGFGSRSIDDAVESAGRFSNNAKKFVTRRN